MTESTHTTGVCPLCQGSSFGTIGRKGEQTYHRCHECGVVIGSGLWSSTRDADAAGLYDQAYLATMGDFHPTTTKRYENILERIEDHTRGRRLIEVGFGNGQFLDTARRRGWDVAGVEISRAACDGIEAMGIQSMCGLFEEVAIAPNSIDAVASMETIEHLYDPVSFVTRAREVLVPGGVLFLTTPNAACLTRRLIGMDWRGYARGHTLLFSVSRLRRFLSDHGFATVHTETRTIVPQTIVRSLRKRLGKPAATTSPATTELQEIRDGIDSRRALRLARAVVNAALNATGTGEKTLLLAKKS